MHPNNCLHQLIHDLTQSPTIQSSFMNMNELSIQSTALLDALLCTSISLAYSPPIIALIALINAPCMNCNISSITSLTECVSTILHQVNIEVHFSTPSDDLSQVIEAVQAATATYIPEVYLL